MKKFNTIILLFISFIAMFGIQACQRTLPEEMTELILPRCLTPTTLSATIENDFDVQFSWVATKDVDSYNLVIATDAECTEVIRTVSVTEVPFGVTLEPGVYYYKVQATAEDRGNSGWTYCTKPVTVKAPLVTVDLSSAKTANCYVISEEGKYKFKTTRGNTDTSVGDVNSAYIIWETSTLSAGNALAVNTVIEQVSLDENGYVVFTTPSPMNEGNALIAVRDADGKILWSWHIWIVSDKITDIALGNGVILMDRNIGETSAAGTPRTSMLYQWGRKDPFPGTCGDDNNVAVAGTLASHMATTLAYQESMKVPTVLYGNLSTSSAGAQPYGFKDGDTDYWGTSATGKTEYDPCPAGYRVPYAYDGTAANDNNLSKTRFAALSSLTFHNQTSGDHYKNTFDMTTADGSILRFGRSGHYLLNTNAKNSSECSTSLKNDKNAFYFWTSNKSNKRQGSCVRVDENGAAFWIKNSDSEAKYQAKNNAYAVRCEKIND